MFFSCEIDWKNYTEILITSIGNFSCKLEKIISRTSHKLTENMQKGAATAATKTKTEKRRKPKKKNKKNEKRNKIVCKWIMYYCWAVDYCKLFYGLKSLSETLQLKQSFTVWNGIWIEVFRLNQ